MTKQKGLILSISSILIGFILNGLAWSILSGPTFSTLGLLIGIGLMGFGAIMFIISVSKN